jgi:predicted HTH domain antitoxin
MQEELLRSIGMTTISFEMPDSAFSALRRPPAEFAAAMRLAAAIHWYSRGEISQGKAAEIAGISRRAFMDELARQKIDAFAVDFDDLDAELARG